VLLPFYARLQGKKWISPPIGHVPRTAVTVHYIEQLAVVIIFGPSSNRPARFGKGRGSGKLRGITTIKAPIHEVLAEQEFFFLSTTRIEPGFDARAIGGYDSQGLCAGSDNQQQEREQEEQVAAKESRFARTYAAELA
jgi:hypothetical protein